MLFKKLFVVWFLLVASFGIQAKSSVWKVTDGDSTLFLGGTIHLLTRQDYPLPREFDIAYQQSRLLVFEVRPDIVNGEAAQQKFIQYAHYKNGDTLFKVLDTATYTLLNDFLSVRGLSIDTFNTMKPGMLSIVLTVLELQRLGLAGQGVDEFFSEKSKQDNKQQFALETMDDQFRALSNLGGAGRESFVIRHAIKEAERITEVMQNIKRAWRAGDNQALIDISIAPLVDDFPQLYESLLVQRNNRWLPQIEQFLKTPDTEYVLVGALHLVGNDGLISLLRKKGYKIEQVIIP